MVDGKPRWLTALGETDGPQGWRANTKNGGVVIDYATRDVIVRGLSMPHSPRWYRDRFWILESGKGSLATIDLASGKVETVARLPGFTRGLDFVGPLAFVGLSQLRETNPLTDIPITDENIDRMSGVWVVNIETGETIALLKFGDAVQELFAVQAIPNVALSGHRRRGRRTAADDLFAAGRRLSRRALRAAPRKPPESRVRAAVRCARPARQERIRAGTGLNDRIASER